MVGLSVALIGVENLRKLPNLLFAYFCDNST